MSQHNNEKIYYHRGNSSSNNSDSSRCNRPIGKINGRYDFVRGRNQKTTRKDSKYPKVELHIPD
jgi:hypothetical protein